jgi:hypothetical protein
VILLAAYILSVASPLVMAQSGNAAAGQGRYLEGLAWYELSSAQARSIDADTKIKVTSWRNSLYSSYLSTGIAPILSEKDLRERLKRGKVEQTRAIEAWKLQNTPRPYQIASGQALNALLVVLSDPNIGEGDWYTAQVDVPPDVTIRHLVFQFVPRPTDKDAVKLATAMISLGRLEVKEEWPIYLKDEGLRKERESYTVAYNKIIELSLKRQLNLDAVAGLDRAIDSLKRKVPTVVKEDRGFRDNAVRQVADLVKAAAIFDAPTIDFIQELIADTHDHEAHTVREMVGFMHKYRLLFAPDTLASGGAGS